MTEAIAQELASEQANHPGLNIGEGDMARVLIAEALQARAQKRAASKPKK